MAPVSSACTRCVSAAGVLLLAGCGGAQSALAPAGREAARIAELWWWMAAGAAIVWVWVLALTLYCVRADPARRSPRRDRLLIVGAGVVVPVIVLTVLLVYGLAMLPPMIARAPDGALRVEVVGEQWWWRVRYLREGNPPIELANEIRLPVGEPVQFTLSSDNVIHSFWVPPLGGKMDMIPGRVTQLALRPTTVGSFRGACAEYCGASHALMAFAVEVMARDAFDRWLRGQTAPAALPSSPRAVEGEALFFRNGCSACHTIAGTPANATIGPDLTHVGSRSTLAAGILPNDEAAFARWLAETERIKPGVHMPAFGMLPADDVQALAAYLEGLQ
jgi:cytochrome c oxidase subunit II